MCMQSAPWAKMCVLNRPLCAVYAPLFVQNGLLKSMTYSEIWTCVDARTRHTLPIITKFLRTDLKRPKRMPESRIADLHIYLPEPDRSELIAWAESEGRTTSNLVKFIVRQALASRNELATDGRPVQPAKQPRR